MKKNWKHLFVFMFLLLLGSYFYKFLFRPNPITQTALQPKNSVIVTTDKSNYKLNETVKIVLQNGLDRSIWGFNDCGNKPFWGLEKFVNNQWKEMNFSFPSKDEECVLFLCEPAVPKELKSNLKLETAWQLKKICEWPISPIGVPKTEIKTVEKGLYRINLQYALSEGYDQDREIIYSNEFEIE